MSHVAHTQFFAAIVKTSLCVISGWILLSLWISSRMNKLYADGGRGGREASFFRPHNDYPGIHRQVGRITSVEPHDEFLALPLILELG